MVSLSIQQIFAGAQGSFLGPGGRGWEDEWGVVSPPPEFTGHAGAMANCSMTGLLGTVMTPGGGLITSAPAENPTKAS